MRMRWRRCLSIVLIAAVLLVNFGSAGTAYASEIDNAGEEQVTESANEASAESGEGSQQGDGLTEGAEKGDEDADSVEPGEADNNDEGKQEGDAAEGQDATETDGSGKTGRELYAPCPSACQKSPCSLLPPADRKLKTISPGRGGRAHPRSTRAAGLTARSPRRCGDG